MEIQNIEKVIGQYKDKNEWLAFDVFETDAQNHPIKGKLIAHSPSRDALWEFVNKHECKHFYVTYTGKRPKEGIIPIL